VYGVRLALLDCVFGAPSKQSCGFRTKQNVAPATSLQAQCTFVPLLSNTDFPSFFLFKKVKRLGKSAFCLLETFFTSEGKTS
jgi:hypothetical protein